jgi:CheY-like chemotaxis protein
MKRIQSGSAVPRHLVFVLADGSFVVQWNEAFVQDLLNGRNRPFKEHDFGHNISDYELVQLQAAGRVEQFNRNYIWLFSLPEQNRFIPEPRTQEQMRDRIRGYYLNTTLPDAQLDQINEALLHIGLEGEFRAANRSELVVVFSRNGMPFVNLKDAEHAQQHLKAKSPDLFKASVIAFVDMPFRNGMYKDQTTSTSELLDLSSIIAGQTDTSLTEAKTAVVACTDAAEYSGIVTMLKGMKLNVQVATNGQDALMLLEDLEPGLLVMDMHVSDTHAWQMLAKIREIGTLRRMITVIVADASGSDGEQSFGIGIAKVDVYATKPISLSRLRHDIWVAFRRQSADDTST